MILKIYVSYDNSGKLVDRYEITNLTEIPEFCSIGGPSINGDNGYLGVDTDSLSDNLDPVEYLDIEKFKNRDPNLDMINPRWIDKYISIIEEIHLKQFLKKI